MIELGARSIGRTIAFSVNFFARRPRLQTLCQPASWSLVTPVIGNILLTNLAQARFGGHVGGASRANGVLRGVRMRYEALIGPYGRLTTGDLPSSPTTYWVSRRKAEVLAAIDGGLLTVDEACKRYRLSLEEISA
ncbi:DUF1153 domain-containing protein [Sphingopyxis sp. JAI108]|uniref:DUF1153 domain-containing protein n=1 Tax=Sphingopyxis sp. JAI108 TaxID=2723060 RepID=UPI0027B9559E|nr:DUF1153 domain-containing protein [Sphingopyxis sp. JAI108]